MTMMTTDQRPLGEMLTSRQKFLLMNSLMLCMFISALDNSIVATAMPHVLADLGGFSLLSWVFTVYLLSSTVVVPLVGKLSDMFGRKPFTIAGIVIFVAASAACGAAPSMPFLIGARTVQGIGGGIIFACVFSTLGDLFTPIQRAKYMGYFIGAFTMASLTGPALGGFLTDGPGWRWCFFINLPVGIVAAIFILFNLPFTRKGGKLSSIDFIGAFLLSGATISLMLGLVWASKEFGWSGTETIALFVLAAVLLVAFFFQERRHPQAIFPVFLLNNRTFMQANLISMFSGAAIFGAIQYLPTFIQTSLGASATASGLVSTPQSLGLLVTSIVGGQWIARTGRYKYPVVFGAAMSATAAILLHTLHVGEPKWHIAAFMVLAGLGAGLLGPTMSVIIQSSVSHEFMGVATSGRQFFMQISQVLGVAVFGLVFTTSYGSAFTSSLSTHARAEIPPAAYEQFQDPTLALDPVRIGQVQDQILALPDGRAVMDQAIEVQKSAVATAIDHLFLGSAALALLVVALTVTMKEVPLRSSFSAEEEVERRMSAAEAVAP